MGCMKTGTVTASSLLHPQCLADWLLIIHIWSQLTLSHLNAKANVQCDLAFRVCFKPLAFLPYFPGQGQPLLPLVLLQFLYRSLLGLIHTHCDSFLDLSQ